MRFDVVTIFPEFFDVLDVSLVGKARARNVIDAQVHDLRQWTTDVHRTVDDAPYGGGAGMVMKPEVWAAAIDDVASQAHVVLAIPTPAGKPLVQRDLERLAQVPQVVLACGRYEGIDARVAQHYASRPGFEVFEYSLGDYVLNGGEVAALALIEGVARLVPGMMGNPESLVEESHGAAGLLEYPIYTRPAEFRGIRVPAVLSSGNHQAVESWRREQALERTLERRPDMIAKLSGEQLSKSDRAVLSSHGLFVQQLLGTQTSRPTPVEFRRAVESDAVALAELAALTFPDACPPSLSTANIDAFIGANLSVQAFAQYLNEETRYRVFVATCGSALAGYALLELPPDAQEHDGAPLNFVYRGHPRNGPLLYLSKVYLHPSFRGSGLFGSFMAWVLASLREEFSHDPQPYVWLGTNEANTRAQRAYRKLGFVKAGRREFLVGDKLNTDVTMVMPLNMAQ